LISKTNQFNLTTRRHTANDVEQMAKQPGNIALALRAQDRFGDAGVIGVALCRMLEQTCYIDTFLLSCRVIGRGIETALLSYIAGQAKSYGAKKLIGEYIPSKKNSMCSDFYPKHGFTSATTAMQFNNTDSDMYELDLTSGLPERPTWITIEEEFSRTYESTYEPSNRS